MIRHFTARTASSEVLINNVDFEIDVIMVLLEAMPSPTEIA